MSELPEMIHAGRIIPLYPSGEVLKSEGLDSRGFRKILYSALEKLKGKIPEILPNEIVKRRGLILREESYREIHFPTDENSLDTAKYRLKYEELFYFNLLIEHKKKEREKSNEYFGLYRNQKPQTKFVKIFRFNLQKIKTRRFKKLRNLQIKNNRSPFFYKVT